MNWPDDFGDLVLLGETHGNAAGPDSLWTLAEAALEATGAVTIGVEAAERDNALFELFVSGEASRDDLMAGAYFGASYFDGRANAAMLALFERVRDGRRAGADIMLFGFMRDGSHDRTDQNPHEQRMANALLERVEPGRKLVGLVGNLHARRTEFQLGPKRSCRPMAARIADVAAIETVDLVYSGGESWVLMKGGLQLITPTLWPGQDPAPGLRRVERPEFDWEWGVGDAVASPKAV